MFEPSGSMCISFSWCNCPLCSKIFLTLLFQEGKSWEAALERTRCHLCLMCNISHVRAAKPGSYWRALVPPSQWPSKPSSLSTALPALVGALIMHVQMFLVPWEGATSWASSTPFLMLHGPPGSTELRWWRSQYPASWINWGILPQYWYAFLWLWEVSGNMKGKHLKKRIKIFHTWNNWATKAS